MIAFRSSNSLLISAGVHVAFIFFIAKFASTVQEISVQPFRPSEVSFLDETEKNRIRDWLESQRKEQNIQPDVSSRDISVEINSKLQEMFNFKNDDLSKIQSFKELPPDAFQINEQLVKIAPLLPDSGITMKDRLLETSNIGGGKLMATVDDPENQGFAGSDSPASIKIEYDVSDTSKPMELKDDPLFIASNLDFGNNSSAAVVAEKAGNTGVQDTGKEDGGSQVLQKGDGMEARIIGVLKSRRIVSHILPEIPRTADVIVDKLSVSVKITVLGNGEVKNNIVIEKTSGYDYIDQAVKDAALKWKFEALPMSMSWQEQIGVIEIDISFI